jgi:methionine-rich copper-binding protein CopC
VNTTNQMNTGGNPKNIARIFDAFDDSSKGMVDYADWLALYEVPDMPTLDPVTSPTASDVQTLSGTKGAGGSILLNSQEIVPVDEEAVWSYDMPLTEGTNSITLYSRNATGMASGVIVSSIILDTTAPRIYSSVPADGASVRRAVESVDITLIEESTEIDTTATLEGALIEDESGSGVPGQWNVDYNHVVFMPNTALGVGTYTLTIHPTDRPLGNTQTSTITFTVDLNAPEVPTLNEVLSPTRTTPQTISGTKEAGASIWLNNNQMVPADDSTEWSHDLNLSEGENTFRLYARDEAGNRSDEIIFTVVLDRAPPVLQSSQPANGAFVNTPPATVTFFFTDSTTPLAEEPTLATAGITDSASQQILGTWAIHTSDAVVFTPETPFSEGTYTASVQAHDLAGNTNTSTISFTYDATAPSIFTLDPVTSPTNFAVQTLSGTKEANTSIWINDEEVIQVNADTTWSYQINLVEGENHFEIYSMDASGNQSGSLSAVIVYDETAPLPVSTLTADGSGAGTTVTLNWTGYDEAIQGDIASYRVYAEDHLFTQVAELDPVATLPAGTFTHTVENLAGGTLYYFAVVAVDTNNNALTSVTPVSAIPTDTAPPEDVSNPHVQCFDTRLIFTWEPSVDTAGDLAGYKVYFNNDPEGILLSSNENSYEATGLSPASSYPFLVTAYDTDGRESSGVSITGVTLLENPANVSAIPHNGYVDIAWTGVEPSQLLKHYSIYFSETDFSDVEGMSPALNVTAISGRISGLTNNSTYYFAVTAVNLSDGEPTGVSTVSAIPISDDLGPEITEVNLNGTPLSNDAVLRDTGLFTLNAADPAGVSRVEFYVDGNLHFIDSNGPTSYSCVWDVAAVEDGEHQFDIVAYDTRGNSTTNSYTLVVALDPPSTPSITQPASGTVTNSAQVTVSGHSAKYAEILLYRNGQIVGNPIPVDASGNFSISLDLNAGENHIQAAAQNRGGTSELSPEVVVTLDTTIPNAPISLTAQAMEGGLIRLSWQRPLDESITGYNVYRSASAFASASEGTRLNTNVITGTSFDDLPAQDGVYYYRISAVKQEFLG